MNTQIPAEDISKLAETVITKKLKKKQSRPQQRTHTPQTRNQSPSPAHPPAKALPPGMTPAAAAIEREKAALRLAPDSSKRQGIPPKTKDTMTQEQTPSVRPKNSRSRSFSGTAAGSEINFTCLWQTPTNILGTSYLSKKLSFKTLPTFASTDTRLITSRP
ncbi:hypothetical protein E2C01_033010 [Portunus trituberculatus]|uniref:Uncharacterized protein n=1 Tax=Portunus trituberculatus TaxID=210409 RepID=A0A5B7F317_PORTR|nr:hypothetical protein [Portunus trituberculatus]